MQLHWDRILALAGCAAFWSLAILAWTRFHEL